MVKGTGVSSGKGGPFGLMKTQIQMIGASKQQQDLMARVGTPVRAATAVKLLGKKDTILSIRPNIRGSGDNSIFQRCNEDVFTTHIDATLTSRKAL